jgi:SAM-dependent methyltransferase
MSSHEKGHPSGFARRLLGMRGIHGIAVRLGWKSLRSMAFDEKYRNGAWNFSGEDSDLMRLIETYAAKGNILALGCGTAQLVSFLKPDSFESFLGVDLSPEAIAQANQRASDRVKFEVGDMTEFQCRRRFEVILFPDSIYYVNARSREKLLRRMRESLSPGGRVIVAIAQPQRYADILGMIRRKFKVDVDMVRPANGGHLLAFS